MERGWGLCEEVDYRGDFFDCFLRVRCGVGMDEWLDVVLDVLKDGWGGAWLPGSSIFVGMRVRGLRRNLLLRMGGRETSCTCVDVAERC